MLYSVRLKSNFRVIACINQLCGEHHAAYCIQNAKVSSVAALLLPSWLPISSLFTCYNVHVNAQCMLHAYTSGNDAHCFLSQCYYFIKSVLLL